MLIALLNGRDLPRATTDAWSELQLAEPTLASPFFRPEFTRIVAQARDDVFVGLLEGGGFFPFQRGRVREGLPVGSRLSDYHGLVAPPETDVDVRALLRACRLSTWEFDGLVASQRAFLPFQRTLRSSPVIDLAHGYEMYAASRREAGSTVLADAARKAARLSKRYGTVSLESHVADSAVLERLMSWKSAQYQRTGAVDIFGFGWVRDVVRRVHATQEPGFAGLLSVLSANGEAVAMHLGLRSTSVWHWWLPAYHPAYAAYSPGIILVMFMAKAAQGLGLGVIDFGKGDAPYKHRLANSAIPLAAGAVERASLASASRAVECVANAILQRTPARAAALRASTRRRMR